MSQQPGSGSGPYGPQGQNPYGQKPGQNPPQNPYGSSPTPTPAPQASAYPAAPSQPTPGYGASAPSATPASGTPRYGAPPTPPPTPAYGSSPTPPPTPAYGAGTPSPYGSPTPPSSFSGAPTPPPATPSYGGAPSSGPQPYVPGQPAQGWSGDARAPQAYSPAPGAFPPAPPKKKSRTGLVIGVVAAVLVLLVGGGYLVSQALKKPAAVSPIATPTAPASTKATTASASASTSATSTASGFPGFTQSGSTLTGSNFTTTLPTGWTLSAKNGGKNEGEIVDHNNNLIDYFSDYQRNATENCAYQAASVASATGVETAQPPVAVDGAVWAGDPATGVEVTLKRATQTQQEVVGYYCVDHAGVSVLVRSIAWASNKASVQTGAKQLLASWKWQ